MEWHAESPRHLAHQLQDALAAETRRDRHARQDDGLAPSSTSVSTHDQNASIAACTLAAE